MKLSQYEFVANSFIKILCNRKMLLFYYEYVIKFFPFSLMEKLELQIQSLIMRLSRQSTFILQRMKINKSWLHSYLGLLFVNFKHVCGIFVKLLTVFVGNGFF